MMTPSAGLTRYALLSRRRAIAVVVASLVLMAWLLNGALATTPARSRPAAPAPRARPHGRHGVERARRRLRLSARVVGGPPRRAVRLPARRGAVAGRRRRRARRRRVPRARAPAVRRRARARGPRAPLSRG